MLKPIFTFFIVAIILTKTHGQIVPDTSTYVKKKEARNLYYVTTGGGIISNFFGGHIGLGASLSKNVFEIKYIYREAIFPSGKDWKQRSELFAFSYGRSFMSNKTEISPMLGLSIGSGSRKGDITGSGGWVGGNTYEEIKYKDKMGFIIQLEASVNAYKSLSYGVNIFYNKNSELGLWGILGIVRIGKLR